MANIALLNSVLSRVHIRLPGRICVIALWALALLVFARPASADTRTVTNTLDSGPGSLRQVVLDAVTDDTVVFDSTVFSVPLTITLTSGQIEISKSLKIDGEFGVLVTPTISGADTTRIFQVDAGVSVALNHLHLVDGACTDCGGGAISNAGLLTVTNSLLEGNKATYVSGSGDGGAIANSATLYLMSTTLTLNNALSGKWLTGGRGGAIYGGGLLILDNATFISNTSSNQGGAILAAGTVSVTNSRFYGNYAAVFGGGIDIDGGDTYVDNTTFAGNSSIYGGGAIYNGNGHMVVDHSQFEHNLSADGGGIHSAVLTTVNNSTFISNTAYSQGGALHNDATFYVSNSTIVSNTAYDGGAIWSQSHLTVDNSTLAWNTALSGAGFFAYDFELTMTNTIIAFSVGGGNCRYPLSDGGHNIFSDNSCGFSNTHSLSNTNPLFGPLGYHGGPVMTLPLLPGSPAIDAGDDSACPPTDARGVVRPFGAHCDIGAYEANWPQYYLPLVARQ